MKLNNINDLIDMWKIDSKVDEFELDKATLEIPNLHAKYMSILATHNLILKKTITDYNTRKHVKWQYYRGELNNPEDLKELGAEPMQHVVLKQDVPGWLEQDADLNNLLLKKAMHEEIVDTCKEIIKQLNFRHWQIRNAIEWRKFQSGV